jgi:hypothetical protein
VTITAQGRAFTGGKELCAMHLLLGLVSLCLLSFLVMIAVSLTRMEKKVTDLARYVEVKVTRLYNK